jgi:hypothetical protein
MDNHAFLSDDSDRSPGPREDNYAGDLYCSASLPSPRTIRPLSPGEPFSPTRNGSQPSASAQASQRSKPYRKSYRRTMLTEDQVAALKEKFERDPTPGAPDIYKMANELELPAKVVRIWFQNRRARTAKDAKPATTESEPEPSTDKG